MSKALQFAVPTISLKEKAVSFTDLARWSLVLCPFPLGSAVCGVALMFPLAHSAFAFLYFEEFLNDYCNLLNSKLIFSASFL